jgi:formylglycine-generating enzyme required for sulfatase activity
MLRRLLQSRIALALSLSLGFTGVALAAEGEAKTQAEMKPYKAAIGKHLDFLPIPGGKFMMGSPKDEKGRKEDEGPQFEVEVEPFWMGKVEVTWDDFQLFRDEYPERKKNNQIAPKEKYSDAVSIPTPLWEQESQPILKGMGQFGGYPVADISQFAAKQFSKWLSKKTGQFYRLPTEAEWEYAARAGTTTAYNFGATPDKLGDNAIYFDNSAYDDPAKGHPQFGSGYRVVGSKKPNAWGLHDMHGNVAEWVIDAYDAKWYQQFAGKSVKAADVINWPTKIFPTVARGGHWDAPPEACRIASRLASEKQWQYRDPQLPKSIWWYTDAFHVGFRLIRPLKEPNEEEKLKYWEAHTDDIKVVLEKSDKELRTLIEKK